QCGGCQEAAVGRRLTARARVGHQRGRAAGGIKREAASRRAWLRHGYFLAGRTLQTVAVGCGDGCGETSWARVGVRTSETTRTIATQLCRSTTITPIQCGVLIV